MKDLLRTKSTAAMILVAAVNGLFFLGKSATAQDAVLTFSVMGDVPYSSTGETTLQKQIADHNKYSPSEFMVHVGDIKPGGGSCPESVYQKVAGYLLNLKAPTFIIPGDNEWTGCSNWDQAWSFWENHFMSFEENFCGAPSVDRQSVRPENFAWMKKGVLLIGINMPGGNKKNPSLWDQRLQQNADWVVQQLQDHKNEVRGAVIFAHSMKRTQDPIFFDQFQPAAAAFGKPILYIHGNDHSWSTDKPFPQQNITRVCVDEGGKALPVQVTVTLNTQNMFSFNRVPWNSNSQPINYDPCAEPGPDITVNPITHDYGDVQVSGSATKAIKITNSGNENLQVTGVSLTGGNASEFNIQDASTFTLSPSANRDVVVNFAPASEGEKNAALRLVSNDPDEDPFIVDLAGTGVVFDPPVITSFTPQSGAIGAKVTITGDNFNGASQVTFNGVVANNFTIDSNTQLRADVPSGATTGKIGVTTPGGDATSVDDFTVTAPPPTTTFKPTHDAYVKSTEASSNFGTQSTLRMRQSSTMINSYLKFDITGVSGTVGSAKLRLFVTAASNSGGSVYLVSNNYSNNSSPWTETGLNYSNAPSLSGSALSTIGSVSNGQWVEFDVTATINGSGTYSFGLKNSSSTIVQYSSKEGANDPELVIQGSGGGQPQTPRISISNVTVTEGNAGTVNAEFDVSMNTTSSQEVTVDYSTSEGSASAGSDYLAVPGVLTFDVGSTLETITVTVNGDVIDESDENFFVDLSNPAHATINDDQGACTIVDDDGSGGAPNALNPTDDAYVKMSSPTSNTGSANAMRVRKNSSETITSYLKFDVNSLSAPVQSAKLRLFVTDASNDGGAVYSVSNTYKGTSTPWTESGLNWNNAPLIEGTPLATAGAVSTNTWVEIDVLAAIGGNGIYSFGLKNNSTDVVYYTSKEGTNKPELVMQTGSASIAIEEFSADVSDIVQLPSDYSLSGNFPNPFNPSTTFKFSMPEAGVVMLRIFSETGQLVRTLINTPMNAGLHSASWDGRNHSDVIVASGVYFYQLVVLKENGEMAFGKTMSMALVK